MIAAVVGEVFFTTITACIEIPAQCLGTAMLYGPNRTLLVFIERRLTFEKSRQETAKDLDDGPRHGFNVAGSRTTFEPCAGNPVRSGGSRANRSWLN